MAGGRVGAVKRPYRHPAGGRHGGPGAASTALQGRPISLGSKVFTNAQRIIRQDTAPSATDSFGCLSSAGSMASAIARARLVWASFSVDRWQAELHTADTCSQKSRTIPLNWSGFSRLLMCPAPEITASLQEPCQAIRPVAYPEAFRGVGRLARSRSIPGDDCELVRQVFGLRPPHLGVDGKSVY